MSARPQRGTPEHRKWVFDMIVEAAHRAGKEPGTMGRPAIEAQRRPEDEVWPNDRDYMALGGLPRVRAMIRFEHGDQAEPVELGQRQQTSRALMYIRKLEREVGDTRGVVERLRDALQDAVAMNPPVLSKLDKQPISPALIDSAETVALLSDTHYGSEIDAQEVPGAQYNWEIASRRTGLFVRQIANWKPHHRKVSRLRLLLGGDIIEGEIHGQSRAIDALATQVDGARQILTSSIDYLRHHYDAIDVVCTPGNHGRWPQREGRAVAQKWDGLATVLYRGLEAVFRNCKDVTFHIPRTPYSVWKAPGNVSCALTHGDTVVHAGSLGKSINVERLATQVRRWNAARSEADRIRVLAIGHYHTPLITELEDGTCLVVNGCMSGTAPYAQSLGVHGSSPTQLLWESVNGHPVGDVRFVRLGAADEDLTLEGVVPTPNQIGFKG